LWEKFEQNRVFDIGKTRKEAKKTENYNNEKHEKTCKTQNILGEKSKILKRRLS
jgi:hypothetical protein